MQRSESYLPIEKKRFKVSADTFIISVSTLFVLLFGSTGATKILSVEQFAVNMKLNKLLITYADFLSYAVPSIELFICLLLLSATVKIGKRIIPTRRIGIYAGTLLMLAFTIYVIVTMVKLKGAWPCTCGGIINLLTWPQHLAVNVFCFLVGVWAIWVMKKNKNSSSY